MKFHSLEPFVPSGENFEGSKQLFHELGFTIKWDAGDYVGFEKDECRFVLQKFNNREFAENFMITVHVDDVHEFWEQTNKKQLTEKFGIRISPPKQMPYGKESNMIDLAGVCWHFVE
jgi:hypothetical protein